MTDSAVTAQAAGEHSGASETEHPENIPTVITIMADALTFGGAVRLRGEVIKITPELQKQATGTEGGCFLTLDNDAQIRRWGRVMFRPGDCSAEITKADEEERVAAIRARVEDPGMQCLRDVYAEQDAAAARSKLRWRSTSTGRPHG